MSEVRAKLKPDAREANREAVVALDPAAPAAPPRRRRILPVAITLVVATLAALLGWGMWDAYMGAPWTRDGTVRAYVVTMAPEVSGRIVELPVADNQFVHKGDLLMVIDPTDYRIAVSRGEAAVQQSEASAQNAAREANRRRQLTNLSVTQRRKKLTQAMRSSRKPNISRRWPI